MTRGMPDQWSRLRTPERRARRAQAITCPTCQQHVATRSGSIAGHYAAGADDGGRTLCPASSMPIPADMAGAA